ncbi:flagellar hook-length control protein FliK [Halalkalibacter okhensis]|uniref:Flagellar hook-length control protein-like C-terminal domain-containing protein n=1 Tax=Halalkalibacter okhensis TaxID=333138 RepID=A0A0B0IJE4_9BACI|nr:flagellar hook-length control protein FliK [Halalkalibacter okhensis]KHF39776.1 hypothetical protein LQ50_13120 [Halalkalibacter okhensis]
MNTMVASALLMNSTALTSHSLPKNALKDGEGKRTFSQMLGRLNESNEQSSKGKKEPIPLNFLLESLEVAIQTDSIIDSNIDYLPNVWKEDFTTAWMQSTEDELPSITDWSEGKQLAFLAVSYALGDTQIKESIRQKVPSEVIENVLRELELLASVSKISEEKEIMRDDLGNQSIQTTLLPMEWTEQDVEQAIINVFGRKEMEQINSPSLKNRNTEILFNETGYLSRLSVKENMFKSFGSQMSQAEKEPVILKQIAIAISELSATNLSDKVDVEENFQEKVMKLPKEWREDFITVLSVPDENISRLLSNWSEPKQIVFLALTNEVLEQSTDHSLVDNHNMDNQKINFHHSNPQNRENMDNTGTKEHQLVFSLIEEVLPGLMDHHDHREKEQEVEIGSERLAQIPMEWKDEFLTLWSKPVESALSIVASWRGEKQLAFLATLYSDGREAVQDSIRRNFPTQLISNEGIDQLMSLVSENTTDSQNKLTIFTTILTFLQKEQHDLEGKNLNVPSKNFTIVNENRINHSQINTVQPSEVVEVKEGSTIGAESQNNQVVPERLAKPEMVQMYIGDRLPKEMQQQQFLRQLHSILKRGTFIQSPQGAQTLSIKLYPEHLGRLTIQITQQEGLITARIMSSSSATRELVESQLPQLRQAFVQQQLHVDRIEVSDETFEQQQDGESAKDDHATNEREDEREEGDSVSFQNILNEVTINEQI